MSLQVSLQFMGQDKKNEQKNRYNIKNDDDK